MKSNGPEDFPDFLENPVEVVAERLLGCLLERTIDGKRLLVRIVETEAYDESDEASHSHRGRTSRNEVMFGPAGFLYVYFTYGMHYCCNVVSGKDGHGSGVLIRAAEPLESVAEMEDRRGLKGRNLTNGPAKLCRAMGIDLELGGHDLRRKPVRLLNGELLPGETTTRSTRIGISKSTDLLRRHYISGNPWVSRT